MKRRNLWKKLMSMALAGSMVIGLTSTLTACGKDEVITLDVYSQLANYSGLQTGWSADILMDKFNVKLNIVSDGDGVYETRMEDGNLGDIIIWGNDVNKYATAVKNGLLFDWNEDDTLKEYGPYIKKHMPDAITRNQNLTKELTDGKEDTLYGIADAVATSSEDHQMFFYNWDLRWDLYKQLGYPKVNDLDDYLQLLVDMQKLCPTDDAGNKTYAVSLWPDWDDAMVMYVKATATAYYGYDELGVGLYDSDTGTYHDALEENGPYLQMLKFFNNLNQKDLLDPNSMTQTYDKMIEKVQNGGVLASIFNYSGSLAYNKKEHTEAGKLMYCMKPEDASPIVYGMNTQGGSYITSIGASTEYPDLCMEILNYFCTPEGRMTYGYGPKGECWDYDEEGNTYFTELGKKCHENKKTKMGSKHEGTYSDGELQAAFATWSIDAENPDSNGETYNSDNWKSNVSEAETEIEQDWRDKTGCVSINDYFEKGDYVVAPGTSFTMATKDDELKTTWSQVTNEIKNGSWKAMYAKTDAEYEKIVNSMIKKAKSYGYDTCVKWSKEQAAERHKLEQQVTAKTSK
ncbi:MAG: hypothetical protein PUH02_04115 [bacterium]|nr:hypothetical protein [bacterium]